MKAETGEVGSNINLRSSIVTTSGQLYTIPSICSLFLFTGQIMLFYCYLLQWPVFTNFGLYVCIVCIGQNVQTIMINLDLLCFIKTLKVAKSKNLYPSPPPPPPHDRFF
jgi:hypothetical protein